MQMECTCINLVKETLPSLHVVQLCKETHSLYNFITLWSLKAGVRIQISIAKQVSLNLTKIFHKTVGFLCIVFKYLLQKAQLMQLFCIEKKAFSNLVPIVSMKNDSG